MVLEGLPYPCVHAAHRTQKLSSTRAVAQVLVKLSETRENRKIILAEIPAESVSKKSRK